jgi:hypothetical protein
MQHYSKRIILSPSKVVFRTNMFSTITIIKQKNKEDISKTGPCYIAQDGVKLNSKSSCFNLGSAASLHPVKSAPIQNAYVLNEF